jgi:DNA recombination protein Rad52
MPFTDQQQKRLSSKLSAKAIKTRDHDGKQLSYIEGWYAIAEANRLFGFDGWDRETISAACVWEDARRDPKACAYAVRVRIHVRAGETRVFRDGSGVGHGVGKMMGEAHESALKEAETDATKRALTTFGNLFGLALYDKERAGVRGGTKPRGTPEAAALRFMSPDGELVSIHDRPQSFCTAIRGALERAASLTEISRLWERNGDTLMLLRTLWPELRTPQGVHYAAVIEALHRRQLAKLNAITIAPALAIPPAEIEPVSAMPRRLRDPAHLRLVAELPCIVCGRAPSQAHHLLLAQPRAMGRKVSDEWTLPLCALHHRALHDAGNEERWWDEHRIDAKTEAGALWQRSRDERAGQAAISTVAGDHAGAVVAVSPNHRADNRRNMIGDAVVEAE